MKELEVTPELVKEHGLSADEYNLIKSMLGNREATFTELGLFSVMWSEHCSYKNSKPLLKKFPKSHPKVLVGFGDENAGIVDIGNGFAISFKVESHNHPSAIEPFQGAATGVGGIIRDIFAMGARPVALLNSLRFGNPGNPKTKWLINGVVSGIAHYGNCIGVPTIGGEVYFEDCYDTNPLVNVMCLGLLKHEDIAKGAATGIGNSVIYVGAATGRDGIHGATFASEDLTEESEKKRPAVQVGDPFMEKLLLEACLELYKTGCLVGVQDMGAAGLACSTSETAARGNAGMIVDLEKVPMREEGMIPYEILCSESQERMLVIIKQGMEQEVDRIFKKWDLHAAKIGEVVAGDKISYRFHGVEKAQVKGKDLTDNAPLLKHEEIRPAYLDQLKTICLPDYSPAFKASDVLVKLLASPSIASKRKIYEQYDHMVQTNTIIGPSSDASVIHVKEANVKLAMTVDCNSRYVYCDPYQGSMIVMAEAARNIVASGATPLAISDCLNFGNPHQSEVYYQLSQSIEGIKDASIVLDTPVTGGNVSLYNQNPKGAVYPTPTIAMVGVIQAHEPVIPMFFSENQNIYVAGPYLEELGATEYAKVIWNMPHGTIPVIDIQEAKRINDWLLSRMHEHKILSCHDIADGGLLVALAECCFARKNPVGADILLPFPVNRLDAALFGETQSRFILCVSDDHETELRDSAAQAGIPLQRLGKTGGNTLSVRYKDQTLLSENISTLFKAYDQGLDFLMAQA